MSLPPRSANTNFMQGYSTMPTETSTTTLETLLRASREYGEDILQAAPPRSNTPPSAKPVARIGTTKPEPPPQVPFKTHEAPPWLKLGSPERKARAAESPSFAWRADTTAAKPPTPTPKPPPRPLREQVVEEPVKYAIRGPKRVELGRYRQGLWGPPSRNALYGPGSMIASLSHNHAVSYKLDAKDLFLRPQSAPSSPMPPPHPSPKLHSPQQGGGGGGGGVALLSVSVPNSPTVSPRPHTAGAVASTKATPLPQSPNASRPFGTLPSTPKTTPSSPLSRPATANAGTTRTAAIPSSPLVSRPGTAASTRSAPPGLSTPKSPTTPATITAACAGAVTTTATTKQQASPLSSAATPRGAIILPPEEHLLSADRLSKPQSLYDALTPTAPGRPPAARLLRSSWVLEQAEQLRRNRKKFAYDARKYARCKRRGAHAQRPLQSLHLPLTAALCAVLQASSSY